MASEAFDGSSWAGYFEITSSATLVDEAVGNLLYDLSNAPASFWAAVASDGKDVRVTNAAGDTAYSFELVNFDSSAETGVLFFDSSADLSASVDTTWRVYAGNASATMPAANATLGRENVWDANYEAVFHLDTNPGGSAPQGLDSTNNDHDLTTAGSMTSGDLVDGPFGGSAWDFDGSDDRATTAAAVLSSVSAAAVELWVKPGFNPVARQTSHIAGQMASNPWDFVMLSTGPVAIAGRGNLRTNSQKPGAADVTGNDDPLQQDVWTHLAIRHDGSTLRQYANGVEDGTVSQSLSGWGQRFSIGDDILGLALAWLGTKAEVRLSSAARSANYVSTHYNNQSDPAGFWTSGAWQVNVGSGGISIAVVMHHRQHQGMG